MLKELVKSGFEKIGLKVEKLSKNDYLENNFTMEGALQRCVSRGLNVNSVIDIGASDGRWSDICIQYLPKAKYLLIEAQGEHEKGLLKFISKHSKSEYIIAAAGGREGKIFFNNEDLLGGIASEEPFEKNCIEVPVVTVDKEVKERNLKAPYLIKLDTHGFEVPILEGALNTIKSAELIIIETYNYKLTKECLKYYEMCKYMENLGFSSIEMVDFFRRKYDNSFWQMDTFFIRSDRKEFTCNKFNPK